MHAPRVIAVDFDGVICAENFPQIGAPCMPIIAALKQVRGAGYNLVLNTCREGQLLADAVRFCDSLGLCFDAVNKNLADRITYYGGVDTWSEAQILRWARAGRQEAL